MTFNKGHLKVSNIHKIYYEEFGNPNGIPIVFIEVKKPNNREGVIAERNRINIRFKNKKFQKFINLFQFIIYSNNMEYDDNTIEPIEGAFYGTTSYREPIFNYFREEETFDAKKTLQY